MFRKILSIALLFVIWGLIHALLQLNSMGAHNPVEDCGKVLHVDRTERAKGTLYYHVTYKSQVHNESKTFKVTPATYADAIKKKEANVRICWDVEDPQYESVATLIGIIWFIIVILLVVIVAQLILISNE